MEKPFIYFERLKLSDKISMIAYAVLTIGVFLKIVQFPTRDDANVLFLYSLLSQVAIWPFLYISLRNFTSYIIWLIFALVHIMFYFALKNNQTFENWRDIPITYLFNPVILLFVFQICRFFSVKIQRREFYFMRGGKDINSDEKASITDFVITMTGTILLAALVILADPF